MVTCPQLSSNRTQSTTDTNTRSPLAQHFFLGLGFKKLLTYQNLYLHGFLVLNKRLLVSVHVREGPGKPVTVVSNAISGNQESVVYAIKGINEATSWDWYVNLDVFCKYYTNNYSDVRMFKNRSIARAAWFHVQASIYNITIAQPSDYGYIVLLYNGWINTVY